MEPALSIDEKKTTAEKRARAFIFSNESVFILACTLSAFLLRLFFIAPGGVINGDGVYYATLGKKLISGDIYGGISAYWSPLYSLLIGIASLFFEDLEVAGRFVSVLAGSVLVVPAYFLIRNFFGRASAYMGTLLLVIHPLLIQSSGWVMAESLFALIFTSTVLMGFYALRHGKTLYFFLAGLLLGAAYLTKPESIGFVGLFFALTVGAKIFRRNLRLRRLAAGYAMLLLGFSIFFLPYVVFLHEKTGNWTISQKLLSNSMVDFEKGLLRLTDDRETTMRDRLFGDVYPREIRATQSAPPQTSAPPQGATRKKFDFEKLEAKTFNHLKKQIRVHLPAILPYPFILVGLLGLFFRRWTRQRIGREIYLLSFVACTLLGYALTVIELRYSFTLIPILLGWVSFGITGLAGFAAQNGNKLLKGNFKLNPFWIQILILAALSLSLKNLYTHQFRSGDLQNVPYEEKQAGLWLRHHSDKGPLVMASSAIPAFYAEANHVYVPDEELPVVLEYAKRKKVDYLIISERRLKNTPHTFPKDMKNLPEEFKLVYQSEQMPGYKVYIYHLEETSVK